MSLRYINTSYILNVARNVVKPQVIFLGGSTLFHCRPSAHPALHQKSFSQPGHPSLSRFISTSSPLSSPTAPITTPHHIPHKTMKAFVTIEGGTATVQEIPTPKPAEGEILVRVHYAAQNPTDWKQVPNRPPGRIAGCDFSGVVEDANGSTTLQNGQRIAGFVYGTSETPVLRGAFAEYLVTEPSLVWAIPDNVSDRDAATISLAFATAIQALFQRLGLPEPSNPANADTAFPVLINGGTSSVGLYAVQLAKLAGLRVIATASRKNHELLKSLGADAVVDYNDPSWPETVRSLTDDKLRHAFDCVSEPETTAAVARAISSTEGGHVMCILARKTSELPKDIVARGVKVESTIVYTAFGRAIDLGSDSFDNWGGPTPDDRAFWEKYLADLLPRYLAEGKIKPNPSRELGGMEAVAEGFELQKQGKVRAEKLVYKIAEGI